MGTVKVGLNVFCILRCPEPFVIGTGCCGPNLECLLCAFVLNVPWWRLFWKVLETLEGGVSLEEVGFWGESLRACYLCLLLVVLFPGLR